MPPNAAILNDENLSDSKTYHCDLQQFISPGMDNVVFSQSLARTVAIKHAQSSNPSELLTNRLVTSRKITAIVDTVNKEISTIINIRPRSGGM
jgi:hypothetical protein